MSRIGKKAVDLPSGVTASVSGQTIEVKGPKGVRSFSATDDVTFFEDEYFATGFGQIGRADQSVVAATDDDGVVSL